MTDHSLAKKKKKKKKKAQRKAALERQTRVDEINKKIKEKEKELRPLKKKIEYVFVPLPSFHPSIHCSSLTSASPYPLLPPRQMEVKIQQFDAQKQAGSEAQVRLDKQRKNMGT